MAWLVLITYQTQAATEMLRLAQPRGGVLPATAPGGWAFAGAAVLLSSQLLRGDGACCAFFIRIMDLGPKRTRLILLAFRGIEIGKIQLRHGC